MLQLTRGAATDPDLPTGAFDATTDTFNHLPADDWRTPHPLSPVHDHRMSRHEPSSVAAQIHDRHGNIPGGTCPTDRNLLLDLILKSLAWRGASAPSCIHARQLLQPSGPLDGAGRDSIHSNPVQTPFQCQSSRQGINCGLGRRSVGLIPRCPVVQRGGYVHDRRPRGLPLLQRLDTRPTNVERSKRIYFQHRLEPVRAQLLGHGQKVAGRTVDHDVQPAVAFESLSHHPLAVFVLSYIAGHVRDGHMGAKAVTRGLEDVVTAPADDDSSTVQAELPRDFEPDARAPACDDGDL
mmetsp:Transcript_5351/g.15289  ORF Transcript_5351/g.15289 Transcript_5351/m.15289 type:complete len:294 (-) Transcript_5351:215-1096(-)